MIASGGLGIRKIVGYPPPPKRVKLLIVKVLRGKVFKIRDLTAVFARFALFGSALGCYSLRSLIVKEPRRMFDTAGAFASGDGRTSRWCTVAGIIAPIVVQVCDGGTGKM